MNTYQEIMDLHRFRSEVQYLKGLCGEHDIDLLNDMIEGETSIKALIGKLVEIIQLDEAGCDGLKIYQRNILDRKRRLEERARRLRIVLASVVNELPGRFYRHDLAHVRAFDVEPKVIVTDESAIPSAFWIPQDPKLDESRIRRQLLERKKLCAEIGPDLSSDERRRRQQEIDAELPDIPGACLGNGDVSVRIRAS